MPVGRSESYVSFYFSDFYFQKENGGLHAKHLRESDIKNDRTTNGGVTSVQQKKQQQQRQHQPLTLDVSVSVFGHCIPVEYLTESGDCSAPEGAESLAGAPPHRPRHGLPEGQQCFLFVCMHASTHERTPRVDGRIIRGELTESRRISSV